MEVAWPFNDQRMNEVLRLLKIKHSWEEIREMTENYENIYKHDHLMRMPLNAILLFNDIFDYGENATFERCRNCLIDWLSKHKEFYNDNANIVHERMVQARERYYNETGTQYPFINWIPEYGGMIRKYSSWAQEKWHKKEKIDFFLPKSTPK